MRRIAGRIAALLVLNAAVCAAYLVWARPWQLRWGATDEEIRRPMPGDELNSSPTFLATRAITVGGTPRQIWPWLLQMGYGRAGYYGYDILENLGSPRGIASADRIVPELQFFKVGDPVPISPVAGAVFYAIEPDRYLIWSGTSADFPGGFTWALYPVDAAHTRLVSRIRWSHHWRRPGILALEMITEFSDHLAVRKILEGIKGLVEGRHESFAATTVEFTIYLASLLLFFPVTQLLLLIWRPSPLRRLAGVAAGSGWLIAWFTPIPPWGAAAIVVCVAATLFVAHRRGA